MILFSLFIMIKVIFLQGTATHLAASLRSMAYFNSRTLGFYPGVDTEDKEDKGIPDELVLDAYEWDSYDDDPYQDIRPHLSMESVSSQINGYPGQALNHISVTPVLVATAGAGEKMREPPDMDLAPPDMDQNQDQELPVTSQEKRGKVSPAQGDLNTSLSVAEELKIKGRNESDNKQSGHTISSDRQDFNSKKSSHDSHTKASYSQYRKYQQPHEEQETDNQEIVPVNINDIRRMEELLPEKFTESCNTGYDINQCEVLCTFTLSSLQLETVAPIDERTDVTMVQEEVVNSAMENLRRQGEAGAGEEGSGQESPLNVTCSTPADSRESSVEGIYLSGVRSHHPFKVLVLQSNISQPTVIQTKEQE